MQEETDRREAIRKSFRLELERQRQLEWEMYEKLEKDQIHKKEMEEKQIQRRQNLLRQKKQVIKQTFAQKKGHSEERKRGTIHVFGMEKPTEKVSLKPKRVRLGSSSTLSVCTEKTLAYESDEDSSFIDVPLH